MADPANTTSAVDDAVLAAFFRRAVATGMAAALTGLVVGGAGGRLVMFLSRLIADDRMIGLRTENGNVIGEFTVDGTMGLVIFVGLFAGLAAAVLLVIVDPWIEWAGLLRSVVFGCILFALGSRAVIERDNQDFSILGNQAMNVAMFASLFIVFGLLVVWLRARLLRWLPPAEFGGEVTGPVYALLTAPGLVLLLLIPLVVGGGGLQMLLLVGLVVFTLASLGVDSGLVPAGLARPVDVGGHVLLAAIVSAAIVGAIGDVAAIIG
jgi:hypothetical protein